MMKSRTKMQSNEEVKRLIHCGYCDECFNEYQTLEYIAEPNKFAKCCPKCGICDYENGANFKEIFIA